ncbi:MAG: hypothetical protein LBD85_06560 [Oscillospiraceae bacterium]|jgi:hypothetical protein|nr:hypothetical protein [Oscillospiraceae bacterium]
MFVKKCLLLLAVIPAALVITAPPVSPISASAIDEDALDGLAADTLSISVGYFGGPYHEVRTFTADELWAMNVVYADYTFIDNMPSVVIDHVAGVTLADILEAAGVDINSAQSFNFWTKDKTGDYYTSLTKTYLIDTPRCCYYSLPDNFDYDIGAGNDFAASYAEYVPTVIALADDWNRAIAGASFGSDYLNLNTSTRFRLIFGQTNVYERTASVSAKWIYSIEVTLGGAPITDADEVPDREVGSVFRSEAEGSSQGDESTAAQKTPIDAEPVTEPKPLPEPLPDAAQNAEIKSEIKSAAFGYEIRPVAESESDEGGVQQWRKDEMAADAAALPDVARDAPVAEAGVIALSVLLLGAAAQIIGNKGRVKK